MQGGCTLCASDFGIDLGGKSVITAHVRGNRHKDMAVACSSRLVTSFFRPQVSQSVTQFVVAHNLAFNVS